MTSKKGLTCPLCFANSDLADFDCVGKNCAWWENLCGACSILVLAKKAARDVLRADAEEGT